MFDYPLTRDARDEEKPSYFMKSLKEIKGRCLVEVGKLVHVGFFLQLTGKLKFVFKCLAVACPEAWRVVCDNLSSPLPFTI